MKKILSIIFLELFICTTLVFAAGPSKEDIEAYMQDKYGNITWLFEKDLKKAKAINENEFYLGAYDDDPIVVFDPLYALGDAFDDDRVHLMMVFDIGIPSGTMDLYKIKKGDVCVTYSDSIQYVLLLTNYTKYNGAIIQGTKDDFTIDASAAVSINKYNYFRGNKAPKGFIQGNGFRYDNRTYLDICNPETGEYHVLFMDIPDRSISEYKFSVIGYIDPEAVNGSAE